MLYGLADGELFWEFAGCIHLDGPKPQGGTVWKYSLSANVTERAKAVEKVCEYPVGKEVDAD